MPPYALFIASYVMKSVPESTLNDMKPVSVLSLFTIMPACCMPIKAMNMPMPTGMAWRTPAGMASNIFLRRPVTVRMRNMMPSSSTNTLCWHR